MFEEEFVLVIYITIYILVIYFQYTQCDDDDARSACGYPTQYILVIYIPIEQYNGSYPLAYNSSLHIHPSVNNKRKFDKQILISKENIKQ